MPPANMPKLPDFTARVAPKFAELSEEVLFGDIWQRDVLSKRDRSLITCAALTALYRPEQLRFHLKFAATNGLKAEELAEMITHLAFYAGWPAASEATRIADEVFNSQT
jgi:4-carboxymuconolactone decarboxylase